MALLFCIPNRNSHIYYHRPVKRPRLTEIKTFSVFAEYCKRGRLLLLNSQAQTLDRAMEVFLQKGVVMLSSVETRAGATPSYIVKQQGLRASFDGAQGGFKISVLSVFKALYHAEVRSISVGMLAGLSAEMLRYRSA